MSREKILQVAVTRAIENGWTIGGVITNKTEITEESFDVLLAYIKREYSIRDIVFDHGFAKAFWGEGWVCWKDGIWQECTEKQQFMSDSAFVYRDWQYHLQQMVLEEDLIRYLAKFLTERECPCHCHDIAHENEKLEGTGLVAVCLCIKDCPHCKK